MSKETLIILYGGRSAERKVSVMSATNVVSSLDYERFTVKTIFITKDGDFIRGATFDERPSDLVLMDRRTVDYDRKIAPSDIYEKDAVVYPVLHGPMGEDGTIQGFLEVMKMPYAGPSVLFAAATMDKIVCKDIFAQFDLPQVPYLSVFLGADLEATIEEINQKLRYPLFVKPANMGSSVGITKVENRAHLRAALNEALKYDSRVVVEQGVVNPREIECSVIGNAVPEVSFPGEVQQEADFYDYDSKYISKKTVNAVPATLPPEQAEEIQAYAKTAFKAVAGAGSARCDFFIDQTGQVFLNEINTIPGFTLYSMYPALWKNMGLSPKDLINKLVDLGKEAFALRESHLL